MIKIRWVALILSYVVLIVGFWIFIEIVLIEKRENEELNSNIKVVETDLAKYNSKQEDEFKLVQSTKVKGVKDAMEVILSDGNKEYTLRLSTKDEIYNEIKEMELGDKIKMINTDIEVFIYNKDNIIRVSNIKLIS